LYPQASFSESAYRLVAATQDRAIDPTYQCDRHLKIATPRRDWRKPVGSIDRVFLTGEAVLEILTYLT